MKRKLIKKYLRQGTVFAFLEFFSDGSIRTLKGLVLGNFRFFIERINNYHISNLTMEISEIVIYNIPSLSILCYSTDKLLATLLEKSLKSEKKQTYPFKVGLFFLKYALVGVFYSLSYRGGIYIDKFLSRTYFSFSYYDLIMVGLCIALNYLVNWVIYLIKRKNKLNV